jgi:plastocyanin
MKLWLIWSAFALSVVGTFLLSQNIEIRGMNYAAVFLSGSSSQEISLYANKVEPATIEAFPGEEVVFVVKDDSKHDMAEERNRRKEARLESGELGQGDKYSLVFEGAGSFSFYDRLNQDIHVTVTVR